MIEMMGFGFIFFILLIVGVAMFFIWILRDKGFSPLSIKSNNSLDVLKQRYARGEITKNEFDSIKDDIAET
jgi:putative membrane protein